ncbi:hypothetical protein THUN1379_27940 [Paludibacterium sp. THUN1379]|nr:hypothetical protein THUN1379_27940 [Paludibacterium sp. THUN1379]
MPGEFPIPDSPDDSIDAGQACCEPSDEIRMIEPGRDYVWLTFLNKPDKIVQRLNPSNARLELYRLHRVSRFCQFVADLPLACQGNDKNILRVHAEYKLF